MSRRAWLWFLLAALVDAGGAIRLALERPRDIHWWLLVGYLFFAAVLFAVAAWRTRRRPPAVSEEER